MSDRRYVYTAKVDDGTTFETIIIDGTPGDGPGSYLNMSFTQPANVGIRVRKHGKNTWKVHMIALMDGVVGEEALCDYGADYWLPWLRAEHPLTPQICDAFRGVKTSKSWLREYLARTADITCPHLDDFSLNRYVATPNGRTLLDSPPPLSLVSFLAKCNLNNYFSYTELFTGRLTCSLGNVGGWLQFEHEGTLLGYDKEIGLVPWAVTSRWLCWKKPVSAPSVHGQPSYFLPRNSPQGVSYVHYGQYAKDCKTLPPARLLVKLQFKEQATKATHPAVRWGLVDDIDIAVYDPHFGIIKAALLKDWQPWPDQLAPARKYSQEDLVRMWDAALSPASITHTEVIELTGDDDSSVQHVLTLSKPDVRHRGWTSIPNDHTPVGAWHLQGTQLHSLKPGEQISVSVIDGFLKLLNEGKPEGLSVHIFNTSHLEALINFGIEAIRRRTSKIPLFTYNFLLLPVSHEGHYFLLVLDVRLQTLFLFDSLGYPQTDVCQLVLQWLKRESEWRGNVLNVSLLTCYQLYTSSNKLQKDTCNCGVYMLMHVYSLLLHGLAMPETELVSDLTDRRRQLHEALVYQDLAYFDNGNLTRIVVDPQEPPGCTGQPKPPNPPLLASPQNELDAADILFIFSSDSEASPEEQQSDDKRANLLCAEVDGAPSDGRLDDMAERFLEKLVHLLSIDVDMENSGTEQLMDTQPSSGAYIVSSSSPGSMTLDARPQCPENWGEQQSQDSPDSVVSDMLEAEHSDVDCSIGTPELAPQPSFLTHRTIIARTAKKVRKTEKRMRLLKLKHEFIPPKLATSFKHAEQNSKAWPVIMARLHHISTSYSSRKRPIELTPEELKRAQSVSSFQLNLSAVRSLTSLYTECTADTEATVSVQSLESAGAKVRVGTVNINGMTDTKLDILVYYLVEMDIDVFFIQDTRLNTNQSIRTCDLLRIRLYKALNKKWIVMANPAGPRDGTYHQKVGGQICVVKHTVEPYISRHHRDPTNFGCIFFLEFNFGSSQLLVINTYWPCKAKNDSGLHGKLAKWLQHARPTVKLSPVEFIKNEIQSYLYEFLGSYLHTANVIISGDLNSTATSKEAGGNSHPALANWTDAMGLTDKLGDHSRQAGIRIKTCWPGNEPASRIDHILEHCSTMSLTQYGCSEDVIWHGVTDHRPLWAEYMLPVWDKRSPQYHPLSRIHPVGSRELKEEDDIEEYQRLLADQTRECVLDTSAQTCGQTLEKITLLSAAALKTVLPDKRVSKVLHWSPVLVALKAQLVCVRSMLNITRKNRNLPRTHPFIKNQYYRYLAKWRQEVSKLEIDDDQREQIHNWTGHGPDFFDGDDMPFTSNYLLPLLARECAIVHSALHTNEQKHFRQAFSKHVKNLEKLRLAGKHGQVIRILTRKSRAAFNYEVLEKAELASGRKIGSATMTGMEDLQHEVNDFMTKWHTGTLSQQSGMHCEGCNWEAFYSDETLFMSSIAHHGIPQDLQDLMWNSLQSTRLKLDKHRTILGNTLRESAVESFLTPPTREEFLILCQKTNKKGKSASINRLTYNMVKHWPAEVTDKVYDLLIMLWNNKLIPEHHKWRFFCLLPKVPGSEKLEDMRPISLMDVVRKLWLGFFVTKISKFSETHMLLDNAQNAYRHHLGTDSATIGLINIFEVIREQETTGAFCSFDIKRAFDSVSKNLSRIALLRQGVPSVLADYIVRHDENGTVFIRSPLVMQALKELRQKAEENGVPLSDPSLKELKFFKLGISPERGIGQGAVESCVIWNAVFDILLTALRTEKHKTDPIYYLDGFELKANEHPSFADDLLTMAASVGGMQRIAEIVSAYALIFGFDIKIDKLRTLLLQWGNESSLVRNPTLCLRTVHWDNTHTVPMNEDGPIKFVGIMHNDKNGTQFCKLLSDLKTHTLYLGRTKASIECTLLAVNTSINNALLYRGNLATLTEVQYKELDLTLDKLYRKVYKLMPGTSQHILHMPINDCGLQCVKLENRLLCSKWATIHRNTKQLMVTRTLLSRSERNACVRYPGQSGIVPVPSGGHELWTGSMLRSAKKAGLQLMKGGQSLRNTTCEQVYDLAHEMKLEYILPESELHGMYTVGDFTEMNDGTRRWIKEKGTLKSVMPHFELLAGIRCPQEPLVLRPAQCWMIQENKKVIVYEILGFIKSEIVVRKWITDNQISRIRRKNLAGQWVRISPDSPSKGAGSPLRKTYKELFSDGTQVTYRVILTPDAYEGKKGLHRGKHLHRVITDVILDVPPTMPVSINEEVHPIVIEILKAIGDNAGPLDFFTDGSWRKAGGPISAIFNHNKVKVEASAALVIIRRDENWRNLPMVSVALTNGEDALPGSVYPMELLALSLALKIADVGQLDACFFSDSTAAIEVTQQPHNIRYMANKSNLLLLKASTGRAKCIQHVRAHPEKVQTAKTLWTRHMMGNHMADRAAVEDYSVLNELKTLDLARLTYTVDDSLRVFTREECYYWADTNGTPTLQTFQEIVDAKNCINYVSTRDASRVERNDEPKWCGRTYQHAALCAELHHRSKGDRARLIRIMWDLYYHGGTQKKFDHNHDGLCNLCSLPDSAEHWIMDCRAGDINTPPQSYRTALGYELDEHLQSFENQDTIEYKVAKAIIETSYDLNDSCAYHVYLGQLSESQINMIADKVDIHTTNETQRKALQKIAVNIGKILINYVLKQYVYKRSNGKQEVDHRYFANHDRKIHLLKMKQRSHGLKRKEKLAKEKDQKTKVHARSYIDLQSSSLRQRPLDSYLLKADPPTRLGSESGID